MGNATSSALRADDAMAPAAISGADGPDFGSLASLGAPRKFKKKPVLVLDAEELEKAHLLFQEASAELLGEEAPRHAKGAAMLGLAPMDEDGTAREELDGSDDCETGEDDEALPVAEDVLRMTQARAPIDPELAQEQDDYIAQQLESLDVEHRIFPSLPLKSEDEIAAEEEAERAAAQAGMTSDDAARHAQSLAKQAHRFDSVPEEDHAPSQVAPFGHLQAHRQDEGPQDCAPAVPPAQGFPVNPLPEPEPETEALPRVADHSPKGLFGDDPFLAFPTQPLHYQAEPAAVAEQVAQEMPGVPQESLEADRREPEFEEGQEAFQGADNAEFHDEPTDAHAFAYASNPRSHTLHALAEGKSNSLRARLLKERREQIAQREQARRDLSILSRFSAWLRGLFG